MKLSSRSLRSKLRPTKGCTSSMARLSAAPAASVCGKERRRAQKCHRRLVKHTQIIVHIRVEKLVQIRFHVPSAPQNCTIWFSAAIIAQQCRAVKPYSSFTLPFGSVGVAKEMTARPYFPRILSMADSSRSCFSCFCGAAESRSSCS